MYAMLTPKIARLLKEAKYPQYPTGIDDLYYYGDHALTGNQIEYYVKPNLAKPNVTDFCKAPHLEEILTTLTLLYPNDPPKVAFDAEAKRWLGSAGGETLIGNSPDDGPDVVMAAVFIQLRNTKK